MRDPEIIQLRNRFLLAITIALLFSVPLIIFLNKNFNNTNVLTRIREKDTFVILIENKGCKMCKKVNELLDDNSVDYVRLNRDKNKDYNKIMKDLELVNKREEYPVVVYVTKGKMTANLFNISDVSEVREFMKNYELINSK